MKIAVTGEGPTDYGKHNPKTGCWKWGPVAAYIDNIAKSEGKNVELYPIPREDVQNLRLQKRSTVGLKGKEIPARKFSILMKMKDCDAGIYYCDADRESGANNSSINVAERHYKEVYEEVKRGLEPQKAVPMIALRMIECWVMSDKKALEEVYDIQLKASAIPAYPEIIWGDKRNPSSNYPKHYFVRMIRESDRRYKDYESNADDFYDIAEKSDIEVLREKCHISYEKFYTDFVEMLKDA